MRLKKYQIYLCSIFLKRFFLISIVFFCLVIIINFFEEISFSEKYNAEMYYTIFIFNAPSLFSKYFHLYF